MRKIGALAAALVVCGVATATAAVRDDVDRIDARRDHDDEREAHLAVPRTAAGAIDVPRLIVEIRAGLTRGAHEIRFGDSTLSAQDVKTLRELAARFGFERVRIRDDGPHRVGVEFHDADERQRAEPHREERAKRRIDVPRSDRAERRDRVERRERPQRAERVERGERFDGGDRADRGERTERADRSGRH